MFRSKQLVRTHRAGAHGQAQIDRLHQEPHKARQDENVKPRLHVLGAEVMSSAREELGVSLRAKIESQMLHRTDMKNRGVQV